MKKVLSAAAALSVFVLAAFAGCRNDGTHFDRYDDAPYSVGNGSAVSVYAIEIEWPYGEVVVETSFDSTAVTFKEETSAEDPALLLHSRLQGGELSVKYAASGADLSGLPAKRLTVVVPALMTIAELDIETVSAPVAVRGVRGTTLNVETNSGGLIVTDFSFAEADIETNSGDVVLELGEQAFSFRFTSKRGRIDDEYDCMHTGTGAWQHGQGSIHFTVETVSGGLYLRKSI